MEPDYEVATVICVYSINTNYMLPLLEKINKSKESPFYFTTYYLPVINEETISECVKYVREEGKDCVVSLTDTSSYVCTIINERLGYPSPSPLSNVVCRDKYRTRMLVKEFEWCYGFNLGDPLELVVQNAHTFPCMLKPAMPFAGKSAFRCDNEAFLRSKLKDINGDKATLDCVQALQDEMLLIPAGEEYSGKNVQFLLEEFIETNGTGIYQYCIEVFVTKDGKIIPYSIFEEFIFQDGMFLGTVIPPVHFDGNIKPFEDYAIHIGKKLYNIGYKNQGFNIEFWRFPDGNFRLIEINPRVSTPSVDLYEQFSGRNIFIDVTNLVVHNKEPTHTPLSVLKDRLTTNNGEQEYVMFVDFSTRVMGVASSIFDYDLLEDLSTKGYVTLIYTMRDYVLTEVNATKVGMPFAYMIIKGTWNEIVKEEKSLRKDLYIKPDNFKYPNYFTVNNN